LENEERRRFIGVSFFAPEFSEGNENACQHREDLMAVSGQAVRTRRFGRALLILILIVIAAGALWTWMMIYFSYADGERAGVLQKFVRRGWVCKTYEGEIAYYYGGGNYMVPSTTPQLWDFSVRDPKVAAELTKVVGHRVRLHYSEHPGVPTSCFADTRFFVDEVTVTDNEPLPSAPPAGAPQAPAASAAH
jgi:hypothetical protein